MGDTDINSYLDRNQKSIKEIIKNYLIVKLIDYDKPAGDIERDINSEFSKLKEFIKNLNSKNVKGLTGGGSKSRKK